MPDGLRVAMTGDNHPNTGATIVLAASGETKQSYAVESEGEVVELTHAELVRRLECEPNTPATPLPPDTNRRVGRAVAALSDKLELNPAALEPRRRDNQVTRYINNRLGQLRLDGHANLEQLARVEEIRAAFNAELPVSMNNRIRTLMREDADGETLISALTAMMAELPPAGEAERPQPQRDSAIRIVCSMGITNPE